MGSGYSLSSSFVHGKSVLQSRYKCGERLTISSIINWWHLPNTNSHQTFITYMSVSTNNIGNRAAMSFSIIGKLIVDVCSHTVCHHLLSICFLTIAGLWQCATNHQTCKLFHFCKVLAGIFGAPKCIVMSCKPWHSVLLPVLSGPITTTLLTSCILCFFMPGN